MKERIRKINEMAQSDFSRARGMLDMLNEICGTHFGWLNKRVIITDQNGHWHDAYVWF